MHYIYVLPMTNWGVLDSFQQNLMAMGQSIGKEHWRDLMNRGNATMSSYNEFARRDDLSYVPAAPRLKPSEIRFVHWIFHYLDAAHTDESEQIAKDYAAMFKSKNIADPFTICQVMSGNDLPLLVVSVPAKNAADFYSEDERVNATLGNDIRPLQARALAIMRKFEVREGMHRPDLSYPMPAAPSASK